VFPAITEVLASWPRLEHAALLGAAGFVAFAGLGAVVLT